MKSSIWLKAQPKYTGNDCKWDKTGNGSVCHEILGERERRHCFFWLSWPKILTTITQRGTRGTDNKTIRHKGRQRQTCPCQRRNTKPFVLFLLIFRREEGRLRRNNHNIYYAGTAKFQNWLYGWNWYLRNHRGEGVTVCKCNNKWKVSFGISDKVADTHGHSLPASHQGADGHNGSCECLALRRVCQIGCMMNLS